MKVCCHCKRELSKESFQKNIAAPDGLQYRCKDCSKKAAKSCRANRGHLWKEKTDPWKSRSENKDRANASVRARRAANPEKARKDNRRWRETNPFGIAVCVANNRAKELGILSTLTKEEWRDVVNRHNFLCHICGDKILLEIGNPDRLSLDHVIPLSRGGTNAKDNVAPAHNRCNRARMNMMLAEFDIWLDKVYSRRSGHGESKKS